MPHVYINGFSPIDDGTSVRVFEEASFGTPKAQLLWEGKPDPAGMVAFEIPKGLIGKEVRLTAIGGLSKYIGTTLRVSRLGVFHTVARELDRVDNPGAHNLGTPSGWLASSQDAVSALYRSARYKNYLLSLLFAIVTTASPFIGLAISGLPGLAAGVVLSLLSITLGTYATGFSRGL